MLLCPDESFLEQHSSATVGEKDKIRMQNDDLEGNRKSQDEFIKVVRIIKYNPIFVPEFIYLI